MQEFAIIDHFFKNFNEHSDPDLLLGIGDDCAVLNTSDIKNILVTMDTLVLGTHFLASAPPSSIGHKSLAVNLSDIAAMGGTPKWFTLALTMPEYNQEWITEFTKGMSDLAKECNVKLIGGDLTKGPLSITITLFGTGSANILTRKGAKAGDGIFVTGNLGLPSYVLNKVLSDELEGIPFLNKRENKLYYPYPQIKAGLKISNYATSAIDVSDGLIGDLSHILKQSKVSAEIYLENLPVHSELKNLSWPDARELYQYILNGGDEYEILFTAPLEYKEILVNNTTIDVTYIGQIQPGNGSIVFRQDNQIIDLGSIMNQSWKHFK